MTKCEIMPGPCGFVAKLAADKTDDELVNLTVETECPAIKKLIESLGNPLDPMKVCFSRTENPLGDAAKKSCRVHSECPVVTGIYRALTVECGYALKKDVYIRFE